MPTPITAKLWQNKAWIAISKVLATRYPESEFNYETNPHAEYLWTKIQELDFPHTYEEYLEDVMSVLHHEAEMLERAKLSVRALRFSKL